MPSAASEHLVHGMGMTLDVPVWPAITVAEAGTVLGDYPAAGRLVDLHWHSPRPFSAATLLQATGGAFLLKRHHRRLRSASGLAEEHAFIAHLRSHDAPVPEIVRARSGVSAVEHGDWRYELFRSAPGLDLYRDRASWTPFLNHGHAHAAGAALARLHRAAHGYDAPARRAQPLVASCTILPAVDQMAAAETYVAARPAIGAFLADRPWRPTLERLFETFGGGLADRLAGQPPLWTHNDWHPSNLLWTPDGDVRSVFDFGLATRTFALHDLATAIERTAIEWLRLGEDPHGDIGDAVAARALIAGYASVTPLSRDDIGTIIRLLPLVHVEFALSEVDYFAGILGDRHQAALAWDGYLIDHADWFAMPPGVAFLAALDAGGAA